MTDLALRVENLSKLYHIGRAQKRHDTLRDAIVGAFNVSASEHSNDDTIWALKDVSFEVARGEVVGTLAPHCVWCSAGVIGRNGAGPHAPHCVRCSAGESTLASTSLSTWLKILSRITEPTEGRALINGRVDVPVAAVRGKIMWRD